MPSARRGGSASSRKRSFVFSTTDVHFWTTRSASNINQIGQFHQHFPGTKATPPSPVYQPNPSTSSNVASEDAHFRTYESEPRRRVSGYGTLSSNGASRRVETTETTEYRVYERITTHFPSGREPNSRVDEEHVNGSEKTTQKGTKKGRVVNVDLPARHQRSEPNIPTTTIMEDRRIQKEFYRNRSRPDVANSSLRATTNGSAATYHSVAVHSTSNGVLAVSGFQGNETDENIEAWMREQPIALRRLDRHDRLVLKIGGESFRFFQGFSS
ncbi:hypothetical protein QR680_009717 [Steinernema hermaphroditum]|uniref:Uncharacterized protein n=1 Tax=Steinernema hermaphroditum TaxID=289476 RepID=A0AA39IMQ1_9BILA|nr:hypothetical protein QR680_009717 [Steinernema hermaphroditum]